MVYFEPTKHQYKSIDTNNAIDWTSVSSLIEKYKEPFDRDLIAERSSKSKKGKWNKYTPDQIKQIWDDEKNRAIKLGNWYHDQREQDLLGLDTINRHGKELPIIKIMYNEQGMKVAQSQKLIDGIYPELLVYLRSAGIAGQSDLVEVVNGKVYITDYKTNKEIKEHSFVNWEGMSKMMLGPLAHMEDCNMIHYQIQLSIYMYMILKHNPKLKPGGITLQHVEFKTIGENEYGYPIHETDNDENYIIDKINYINLPYSKHEVISIINDHKATK